MPNKIAVLTAGKYDPRRIRQRILTLGQVAQAKLGANKRAQVIELLLGNA